MSDTKKCPSCGETILEVAIKCKHCGSMFSGESPSAYRLHLISNALSSKFDINREIGVDETGFVYMGYQKNLQREVAVRVIRPHLASDQDFMKRFITEGRSIANLDHPNIIKIYEIGVLEGIAYLSFEYLPENKLSTYIEGKRKLTTDEAIRIIAEIAAVLDHIHKLGLVHGNINFANIFVRENGSPILSDFEFLHTSKHSILNNKPSNTSKDIYALGLIFRYLLTEQYPYSSAKGQDSSLPSTLDDIIRKAMASHWVNYERYSSVREFIIALQNETADRISKYIANKGHKKIIWDFRASRSTYVFNRNCIQWRDGTILVSIPGRKFWAEGDKKGEDKQFVELPAYYIAKYPVTNAQYARFLNERKPNKQELEKWIGLNSGCFVKQSDGGYEAYGGKESHPVVRVSWYGAKAYCEWAGLRLPTELEWLKGATGTDGRKYPWGDEHDERFYRNSRNYGDERTAEVCAYPKGVSPFGLYQMLGNIHEWTSTRMKEDVHTDFYGRTRIIGAPYKLYGSAWNNSPSADVVNSDNYWVCDTDSTDGLTNGFRCAKDAK